MNKKQAHCIATWASPNKPEKQAMPLISRQQRTSSQLRGSNKMFKKAHVAEAIPSRTKYVEMPSDDRRSRRR